MHPDSRRKLQPRDPKCYHLTMSTEEHIAQLTAQITTLQAQLTCHSQSPPPPQPSAAPPPPPKPPKVSTPSPFSGVQDNLDHCRWENGPICELPTETELVTRACLYHRPEICYEFDTQKPRILL